MGKNSWGHITHADFVFAQLQHIDGDGCNEEPAHGGHLCNR